jgi:Ca2+-binding EF-hand superfamily protein
LEDFADFDVDGNGTIDADEFAEGMAKKRTAEASGKTFVAMDTDKDGKISKEEWAKKYGSLKGFDEYDKKGNGFVDKGEFLRGEEDTLCERNFVSSGFDKNRKEFRDVDIDRDGKLSRSEWKAKYGSLEDFADFDVDGNGTIDADEFAEAMAKKRSADTKVSLLFDSQHSSSRHVWALMRHGSLQKGFLSLRASARGKKRGMRARRHSMHHWCNIFLWRGWHQWLSERVRFLSQMVLA